MTQYDNLPVYRTTYDFLIQTFGIVKEFPKEYKYTLGDKIKNETVELIANVYRANTQKEKGDIIQRARENTEILRLYIRLTKDLHMIGLEKFIALNLSIESISKQLSAWQKYSYQPK